MATRSFLLDSQIESGFQCLLGDGSKLFPEHARELRQEFSKWLEERLVERLQSFGDFASLKPVLLGSWARHELSPKSDIDLLFAGPESKVKEFIAKAFRDGLKLRARTPENLEDWSVGVEPFDVLALKGAKGFSSDAEAALEPERQRAVTNRKAILKAIRIERDERRKRQDSIS